MPRQTLEVQSFGGGIALAGSAEARTTDEMLEADGVEIGHRGQLQLASNRSDYLAFTSSLAGPVTPYNAIFGMIDASWGDDSAIVIVGQVADALNKLKVARFAREGAATPQANTGLAITGADPASSVGSNLITFAHFPYVDTGVQRRPLFINIGARHSLPPDNAEGLYVLRVDGAGVYTLVAISTFSALGDGLGSKQLRFRGIASYNQHLFGWGFDESEADGEGANRLMFSNAAEPFTWGNDNISALADRDFSDSDAINIGDAGEVIRAALSWRGRLWIATNRELRWIAGTGRDDFLTDAPQGVHRSENVIGPNAMIEGPDGLLYGVGSNGLWRYDGQGQVEKVYRKLVDREGRSRGYWDCIWADPLASAGGYPGQTNQDLVWLMADHETNSVWVVIPFCSRATGRSDGLDTLVLKYHCATGGFTRQWFDGAQLTAGCFARRDGQYGQAILLAAREAGVAAVDRYRWRTSYGLRPSRASEVAITFGDYTPFGAAGSGLCRHLYLTLAWQPWEVADDGLPLEFALAIYVDGRLADSLTLYVGEAPVGPDEGDLWVDTTGTDDNIGNLAEGAVVDLGDTLYLVRRYRNDAWELVPGAGGTGASRVTVPIAFNAKRGTRVKVRVTANNPGGHFQFETLALAPALATTAR